MRRETCGVVFLGCVVVVASGCGGGQASVDFPDPEELQAIAQQPISGELFDRDVHFVDSWALAEPLTLVTERRTVPAEGPLEEAVAAALGYTAGDVTLTAGMRCVAGEAARFYYEQGGHPTSGWWEYVVARCGEPGSYAGASWMPVTFGDSGASEQDIADLLADQLNTSTTAMVGNLARGSVGVAMAGGAEGGGVMLVLARSQVEVEPIAMIPDVDGTVTLRGEVFTAAEEVIAAVTQGEFGYAWCEDLGATLPAFAFRCPVDALDATAFVEVDVRPPDRLLSDRVLLAFASPDGTAPPSFVRASVGADGAGEASRDVLEAINGLRGAGGLAPLRFEDAESATATTLVRPFVAGAYGLTAEDTCDQIALGLMAGWDVGQPVQDAGFASMVLVDSAAVDVLVDSALMSAVTRSILLNPSATSIAIGAERFTDPAGLAALVSVYTDLTFSGTEEASASVLEQLTALRAENGLDTPRGPRGFRDAVAIAAQQVEEGRRTPTRAMNGMLTRAVNSSDRGVQGWVGFASELDEFDFDELVLTADVSGLALSVAPYRPEGAAWAQLVVFVVWEPAP